MSQSKTMSFVESCTNVAVGVAIAFSSQIAIFAFYGIKIPITTNMKMTVWFTAISMARSFILRRIFNRREKS